MYRIQHYNVAWRCMISKWLTRRLSDILRKTVVATQARVLANRKIITNFHLLSCSSSDILQCCEKNWKLWM